MPLQRNKALTEFWRERYVTQYAKEPLPERQKIHTHPKIPSEEQCAGRKEIQSDFRKVRHNMAHFVFSLWTKGIFDGGRKI